MYSYPQLTDYSAWNFVHSDPTPTLAEALTSFNAFQDVIEKYQNGMTGNSPLISGTPTLQIGETYDSNDLTVPFYNPITGVTTPAGYNCEMGPAANTWLSFLGMRQSSAGAAGAIVRPFAISTSCWPFYPTPMVITNGYNKNLP